MDYIVDNEIAPSYDKINKNKLEETVNAALSKRNFKTINSKIYFDDEVSFLRHWASKNNQMDDYFSARIAVIGYDESSDSMAYMNEIGDAAYFELENKEFNNVLSIIPRLLQPIVAQMNHVSSGCYIDVEAIDDQIEINIESNERETYRLIRSVSDIDVRNSTSMSFISRIGCVYNEF